MRKADMKIGDVFGHWTVIGPGYHRDYVLCRCDCGKEKQVYIYNLLRGVSLSCGCHRQDKEPDKYKRSLEKGHALASEMHKNAITVKYAGFGRATNKNSGTGVTGVSLARGGYYRAYITVNRKQIFLGCFDNLDEAKAARKAAEIKYFTDRQEAADKIRQKMKNKNSIK